MSWRGEWRAIDARIVGLGTSARDLVRSYGVRSNDILSVIKTVLIPSANRLFQDLTAFLKANKQAIPKEGASVIESFLTKHGNSLTPGQTHEDLAALQLVAILVSVAAEATYYFSDADVEAKRTIERAFVHLQRSLAVDADLRDRWQSAQLETECEALGAIHLLAHGIWSFKAHGAKSRTDLVLGCPLESDNLQHANAEAMVLTEWKMVSEGTLDAKATEAYEQVRDYQSGLLAGFEVTSARYLVMVSESQLKMPLDRHEGAITYRYINIARNIEASSIASRRLSRSKQVSPTA
jgi:hypothetical protein